MEILIAGGTGTVGLPLLRTLSGRGHRVHATTRSPSRAGVLAGLGGHPIVVDALDSGGMLQAVRSASPEVVIHLLTALPEGGPLRPSDLAATNRLREEGTQNLLRAAIAAGARRVVCCSFAPLGDPALSTDRILGPAAGAVQSMESQVAGAARTGALEGVILRFGLLHGEDVPATRATIHLLKARRLPVLREDRGQLPFLHLEDAVSAVAAALNRGRSGARYDVAGDAPASFREFAEALAQATGSPAPLRVPRWLLRAAAPVPARLMELQVPTCNEATRADLGWTPLKSGRMTGLYAKA